MEVTQRGEGNSTVSTVKMHAHHSTAAYMQSRRQSLASVFSAGGWV